MDDGRRACSAPPSTCTRCVRKWRNDPTAVATSSPFSTLCAASCACSCTLVSARAALRRSTIDIAASYLPRVTRRDADEDMVTKGDRMGGQVTWALEVVIVSYCAVKAATLPSRLERPSYAAKPVSGTVRAATNAAVAAGSTATAPKPLADLALLLLASASMCLAAASLATLASLPPLAPSLATLLASSLALIAAASASAAATAAACGAAAESSLAAADRISAEAEVYLPNHRAEEVEGRGGSTLRGGGQGCAVGMEVEENEK